MSSEPSIITREQIDTLRGLLNDVGASDDAGHAAVAAIGGLLDRVEARRAATGGTIDLDAIRARLNAVPAGPWKWTEYPAGGVKFIDAKRDDVTNIADECDVFDFLADARTDVPALLAEVERLQAKNERQYNELVAWEENYPCDGGCSTTWGPDESCSRHGRNPKDLWEQIERLTRTRNVLADEVDRLTEENARLRLGLRPESGAAAWAQHVGATLAEGVDGAETVTTAPRAANRAPVGESDNAQADDAGEGLARDGWRYAHGSAPRAILDEFGNLLGYTGESL